MLAYFLLYFRGSNLITSKFREYENMNWACPISADLSQLEFW